MSPASKGDLMNYLAHWFFSDLEPDALVGSLWPDFARRPNPDIVPDNFLVHFDRHQWLDRFTDSTPLIEPLRQVLRPKLRKTTPIVIDMLLDHHLAKNWEAYHDLPLREFAKQCYARARSFNALPLPDRLEKTLYWMLEDDWLTGYRQRQNVIRALRGLSRRIRFDDSMVANGQWALDQADIYRDLLDELFESAKRQLGIKGKNGAG